MNRVNPLYLALLLIMILGISTYELHKQKKQLQEAKQRYLSSASLAVELSSLKKAYQDKNMPNKLKRILVQNVLKKCNITSQFKKHSLKLSSQNMDKKALDFLFSKLLNMTVEINSFEIQKLSEDKASINMEIKW